MQPSHRFIALAFIAATLSAPHRSALAADGGSCQPLPAEIESSLAQTAEHLRGAEICEVRSVAVGDVNGDKLDDYVVVYTVEGPCFEDRKAPPGSCGNNYLRFLAAFLRGKTDPRFSLAGTVEAGGRFQRTIDSVAIRDGVIAAETSAFSRRDASCCPSIHGRTSFALHDKKLIEAGNKSKTSRQAGKRP